MKKSILFVVATIVLLLVMIGVQYFVQAPITIHSPALLWYGVLLFVRSWLYHNGL